MKTSIKRTTSLLASVILLVGAIAAYSAFIKPEYLTIVELRGRISAARSALAEQRTAIGQVQDLLNQYRGSAQIREAVSLALPLAEEVPSILNQIQALAQANGLSIGVFNVQTLATRPAVSARGAASAVRDVGVLQMTVKLSGVYEGFKNFLQGLETNIRLMDVAALKVEPAARGSSVSSFTLTVNAYYQIP